MKTAAGAFLAGAASRLLPMSVPFRFFGAAVAFHLLAWLALLAGASEAPHFAGGLGWPLAALHLITLGVLLATAIGASLQLLPVATRQPVRSARWPAAVWWLFVPGVAVLTLGMGASWPLLMGFGAAAVLLALLAYGVLLAANLRGARGMPGVVLHGWGALLALTVLVATAASLVALYLGHAVLDRGTALALHVVFASYGFMGLMALGLSYILVPMFALSAAPPERQALWSGALACAALALAAVAAFGLAPRPLRLLALLLGAASVVLHLRLMRSALASGMRRELGRSFVLVHIGWGGLVLSLVAALGVELAPPASLAGTLFAVMLVGGWLLSFLFGILQRILPFLASMHAARGSKRPPTPSSLSAERPLALHFHCHLAALALLVLAVVFDSAALAALAALAGAAGAVAFGSFYVTLLRRTSGAAPAR